MAGPDAPSEPDSSRERVDEADRILIGSEHDPADPARAAELYLSATNDGVGAAAVRAATMAALGIGRAQDWSEALDLLLRGAVLGDRSARRQLALIAGRSGDRFASGEVSNSDLWRKVRQAINLEELLNPPRIRPVSMSPFLGVMEGFAPLPYARWLITQAAGLLQPSQVNDALAGGSRDHEMRTSTSATFNVLSRDIVLAVLQERLARATRLPVEQHEPPSVISYLPGQKFEEHFDFVDPLSPHFHGELDLIGQRVATCLTYLNADFEGAETHFPTLDIKFRGRPGDALLFFNVHPNLEPDRRTLHAGLPPTKGRKWLLSQWLRDRVQLLI